MERMSGDRLLKGHSLPITDIAWDDRPYPIIIYSSKDKTIKIWRLPNGILLRTIPCSSTINAIILDHDKHVLYAGDEDGRILISIGNHESQNPDIFSGPSGLPVYCLAISSDGSKLAAGSKDGFIELWDTNNRKILHVLTHELDTMADGFNVCVNNTIVAMRPDIPFRKPDLPLRLQKYGKCNLHEADAAHEKAVNGITFDEPLTKHQGNTTCDIFNCDCLPEMFSKCSTKKLYRDIQFVCKLWYKLTLQPRCWQSLIFTKQLCSESFVKFAVARSKQTAVSVTFKSKCDLSIIDSLHWISLGCPKLKSLDVRISIPIDEKLHLINYFSRWKELERLVIKITNQDWLCELLDQISIHCKNFRHLSLLDGSIEMADAKSITKLQNITFLELTVCFVSTKDLSIILSGCSKLTYFKAYECVGFNGKSEKMKRLGARPLNFDCGGAEELSEDELTSDDEED